MKRMSWADSHPLMTRYYDEEWGQVSHDDRYLFEMLILEGFQAGLSWMTVLKKRKTIQQAFSGFDVDEIVTYDKEKIETILNIEDMIKHRLKVESVVTNAAAFKNVQQTFGSFDRYLWSFTDGKVIQTHCAAESDIPVQSALSIQVSKDLKKRGFKFVGPVTTYTYLSAVGIIQDIIKD